MESKGRIKITGVRPCTSFVVVLCALMIYYNSTYTVQYNTIQYNFIKGCFQFYCSFTENRLLLLCHLHIILVCFEVKIWSLMVSDQNSTKFFPVENRGYRSRKLHSFRGLINYVCFGKWDGKLKSPE